jgi:pimeloyl-ACP methyl ester carboxylesterase/DNA-binding transcriptional MerR regulator
MMGIGEFARLSRLSPKALRLYDSLGLLVPRRVDRATGYRWYSADQLAAARLVAELRQLGVPLATIKALLGLSPVAAASGVAKWWSSAEAQHDARRELAGFLVDRLNGKKRSVMYEVSVRSIPARSVLSMLRYVNWDGFVAASQEFGGVFAHAGVPRIEGTDGASFVVYHGDVSQDSDGPVEWCRPVPPDAAASAAERFPDLVLRTEPAHEEAFVHLARDPAQTPPAQALTLLETLLTWTAEQHRRPSGSVRQVFTSGPPVPGQGLECDFAVPLAATVPEMTSGVAAADGCDLYYERYGDGPPLLLITGGGGDCEYYAGLARALASSFTVITYDRRGSSRSVLHGPPVPIDMSVQSADAIAVLRACGFAAAAVFGNSGGGTIALDLAARYPAAATVVVAHEAPVITALPADDSQHSLHDSFTRLLETEGWRAAFTEFMTRAGGLTLEQVGWLLDPASELPAGPELDLMQRMAGNWEYMTTCEVRRFFEYVPMYERLSAAGVRFVIAVGQDPDEWRGCAALAARMGLEITEFPGTHNAPTDIPDEFAARLREVLAAE